MGEIARRVNTYSPGGGVFTSFIRNLTYFKSDSIEYGSPGWPIGLDEVETENKVLIYPNPVNDQLNIESSEKIIEYKLFDLSGKLLLTEKAQQFKTTLSFNHLASGMYFLNISTENATHTKRVIK